MMTPLRTLLAAAAVVGLVGAGQLVGALDNAVLERRVQLAQFLLGLALRLVAHREAIGHLVKGLRQRAELGAQVADRDALVVIAVAPLPGRFQQVADRPRDEDAAAVPGQDCGKRDPEDNQRDAALGGAFERCDRLRLRLTGAEKQVIGR